MKELVTLNKQVFLHSFIAITTVPEPGKSFFGNIYQGFACAWGTKWGSG